MAYKKNNTKYTNTDIIMKYMCQITDRINPLQVACYSHLEPPKAECTKHCPFEWISAHLLEPEANGKHMWSANKRGLHVNTHVIIYEAVENEPMKTINYNANNASNQTNNLIQIISEIGCVYYNCFRSLGPFPIYLSSSHIVGCLM